jgi:hypothetical protein
LQKTAHFSEDLGHGVVGSAGVIRGIGRSVLGELLQGGLMRGLQRINALNDPFMLAPPGTVGKLHQAVGCLSHGGCYKNRPAIQL